MSPETQQFVTGFPKTMNTKRIEMIELDMVRILAAKSEAERLQIAWGMWQSARRMVSQMVVSERTDKSHEQVNTLIALAPPTDYLSVSF